MIIIFPVMGKIGDVYSLGLSFTVLAVLATVVLSIILLNLRRLKSDIMESE